MQLIVFAFYLLITSVSTQTVHEPMTEHIYFYPRPGDNAPPHIYVKPTELITRHRLQLVTDWPYQGVMGGHVNKPIDLIATAEVSSQPIYFRNRESLANLKLKQKQNILYLELPIMPQSAFSPNGSENKVLE
ncbi:PREDICTED: uncharacterized protein LOC108372559 [Rhagoletis zephyria]|uniref:uncharacterized protein LOC108372559 n=1 Tax=Rhagoletis zephyria TaxID=28612 RepID=UPI00081166A4|nr:PREDICTED: uncharacterized protein LOC108372559 [Rhagoletis zephyria]